MEIPRYRLLHIVSNLPASSFPAYHPDHHHQCNKLINDVIGCRRCCFIYCRVHMFSAANCPIQIGIVYLYLMRCAHSLAKPATPSPWTNSILSQQLLLLLSRFTTFRFLGVIDFVVNWDNFTNNRLALSSEAHKGETVRVNSIPHPHKTIGWLTYHLGLVPNNLPKSYGFGI